MSHSQQSAFHRRCMRTHRWSIHSFLLPTAMPAKKADKYVNNDIFATITKALAKIVLTLTVPRSKYPTCISSRRTKQTTATVRVRLLLLNNVPQQIPEASTKTETHKSLSTYAVSGDTSYIRTASQLLNWAPAQQATPANTNASRQHITCFIRSTLPVFQDEPVLPLFIWIIIPQASMWSEKSDVFSPFFFAKIVWFSLFRYKISAALAAFCARWSLVVW